MRKEQGVKSRAQRSFMNLWGELTGPCLINLTLSDQGAGRNTEANPGGRTRSSCRSNCATFSSPHGWSDPPPCTLELPFLFDTESSQSYSLIQLLLTWPLLPCSVFYCICPLWLSLPCTRSHSHWFFFCAAFVFPEKPNTIPVFVPPALPSPLLHFPLQAPLPSHPVGLCWFPYRDCLFLACL